jgi:DNA repair protein RecN (Recombination protein N)
LRQNRTRMLRQLRIENYALIDRLEIDFQSGVNVLTGETGSGKSIVVEAVGLLLGDKGTVEMIRSGAERARLAGIFAPERTRPERTNADNTRWRELLERLAQAGIDVEQDDELIIERELILSSASQGNGTPALRSRLFVNNQPATVALLRQVAPLLAEIHGQNEQQELFIPSAQLSLLDRFGVLDEMRGTVRGCFDAWRQARRDWETQRVDQQEWLRQMDLWKFQRREIDAAELSSEFDHHLDQKLDDEKRLLTHAERIRARLACAYDLLYDAAHSSSATIASAEKQLSDAAAYDTALAGVSELLLTAKAQVEDAALTVRDRLSHLDASPGRLEEVENRLATLDRLKRKYGPTMSDVISYGAELGRKIAQAEGGENRIEELEQQVKAAAEEYQRTAAALSAARRKAAKELKRAVEHELSELAMSGTQFEARLTTAASDADWRATGVDQVDFLLSPNPGEPLGPLDKIASGGEASRVMLALETVIAAQPFGNTAAKAAGRTGGKKSASESLDAPRHTLIFDEIDSGIGGRAAETVGRKLRRLGADRQVLCVTHLPQIASFAHHHLRVEKQEQDGRTVTRVEQLTAAGRRDELARMMGGTQITPALRKHAEQLLKTNAG